MQMQIRVKNVIVLQKGHDQRSARGDDVELRMLEMGMQIVSVHLSMFQMELKIKGTAIDILETIPFKNDSRSKVDFESRIVARPAWRWRNIS